MVSKRQPQSVGCACIRCPLPELMVCRVRAGEADVFVDVDDKVPAPEYRVRRNSFETQPPSIRSTLRRCRCRRAVDEDVQRRRRPESPVRRVRVVEVDARGRIGVDHGAGCDGSSVRWQASNLMGADQIALAPRRCLVHVVV